MIRSIFSDCVQRGADSIPHEMVGGEGGDTLEGDL